MVIEPSGKWEHTAYQTDTQFIVEVKPVVEDPTRAAQRGRYIGEKLSLNFQNVEVRAVLKVIADFTGLNIITSDTVTGNLTLRLKDVPWDQALDIILQTRGLDMRKTGNVIWIAPRDELATREKLALEAQPQISELEPTRTETFQLNYQKAADVQKLLTDATQRILSKRGSAVVDARTNTLFVQDTPSRLEEVRTLIAQGRHAGAPGHDRGAHRRGERHLQPEPRRAPRLQRARAGRRSGFGGDGPRGRASRTSAADLGNTGAGGWRRARARRDHRRTACNVEPAGSRLERVQRRARSRSCSSTAALTRFLNLELSALEADGKGKIISSPRVLTADQVEAMIEQGTEIPYQQATSSGATAVAFRKANLSLKVKPQITPDGNVIMTLNVNKDSRAATTPAGVAINTKHVKTEVLVENGGTVVIGGIYEQSERTRHHARCRSSATCPTSASCSSNTDARRNQDRAAGLHHAAHRQRAADRSLTRLFATFADGRDLPAVSCSACVEWRP